MKKIFYLVKNDLIIEFRQRFSFYGILLYITATIFLIYLSNQQINTTVWHSLFWIVQLFACVNAVTKNNTIQTNHTLLYYYTICAANEYLISKMILNAFLMLVLSIINFILFGLFLHVQFTNYFLFLSMGTLGGISISLLFTFLSALAQKANQQASMVVILGFPIIIPLFIIIIKITTILTA
ncbi:MAG: heme exporter protein CcmB, partial [Sediminibacterium sp.]|nr:heme exporter protein CcmB [Sediminibacterium sp.]